MELRVHLMVISYVCWGNTRHFVNICNTRCIVEVLADPEGRTLDFVGAADPEEDSALPLDIAKHEMIDQNLMAFADMIDDDIGVSLNRDSVVRIVFEEPCRRGEEIVPA